MNTLSARISEEENLMYVTMGGTFGAAEAGELASWAGKLKEKVRAYFKKTGKKLNTLADVTELNYTSAAILSEMVSLMKDDDPYMHKTATYGANPIIFAAGEVVSALSGRTNFKAFHTEAEARAWLSEP